jgi:hypothetical protein
MKYLDRLLRRDGLSSVPSAPSTENSCFSEEEEKRKTSLLCPVKTDKSPSVGSVSSGGSVSAEACAECGSVDYTVALVNDRGTRTCGDCATGRTAMRRAGAAI